MKHYFSILICCAIASIGTSQVMTWVPMDATLASGPCAAQPAKKQQLCYALQYTPGETGTLTSYTTGFYVSCTSLGPAVIKNISCTMTNNVNLINGCSDNGVVLMNSSGNTGSAVNNKVVAGVPITLHQVCFSIPYGESISIREDEITDLTTSIDLTAGGSKTEYPSFAKIFIRRDRPDDSRPSWLDFKGTAVGDYTTQLDWTTSRDAATTDYMIERSCDGNTFTTIGTIKPVTTPDRVNNYQYIDKQATQGKNYYRLKQTNAKGEFEFSPIRIVSFGPQKFAVQFAPSPASEFIDVVIQNARDNSVIQLIDQTGHVVKELKSEQLQKETRIQVQELNPGIYTLRVQSGDDKFSEKVMIVE